MREAFLSLGVLGKPIRHSLSPAIFRGFLEASGREGAYVRISARTAGEGIALFRELGLDAMNVTSPFKEEVAVELDELDEGARVLAAANLVSRDGHGGLRGANTDGQGVLFALAERGLDPRGVSCLVIGAGGAGRAAAYALGRAGAEVVVANRGERRGALAAALADGSWEPLERLPELARGAKIIVSTLSAEFLPEPSSWLVPGKFVLDADYRKGLLASAQDLLGPPALDGKSWLLGQAIAGWERIVGRAATSAEIETGRQALSAAAEEGAGKGRAVALVGLMGVGKTTVGKELAERLGLPFADLDALIEAEAGRSVAAIFAESGEADFRAREKRALARAAGRGPLVLATGGGIVLDPENRRELAANFETVLINAPLEVAARRAAGNSRPLLAGVEPRERLEALWSIRREFYLKSAQLVIRSAGEEAASVAGRIADEIS